MVGVSNYKLGLDKDGNGFIGYKYRNRYYRLVISKLDRECHDIFIKHYSKLKEFRNRQYAVSRYIVKEIRSIGKVFVKVGYYIEIH